MDPPIDTPETTISNREVYKTGYWVLFRHLPGKTQEPVSCAQRLTVKKGLLAVLCGETQSKGGICIPIQSLNRHRGVIF